MFGDSGLAQALESGLNLGQIRPVVAHRSRVGAGAAMRSDLVGETDMTDMLIRISIGGLGVLLFFLAVGMLVVGGIAGSLRSIFAPRVIIIQNDSTYERQPGLVDTYRPMVTALIWLILLLVVGHILR